MSSVILMRPLGEANLGGGRLASISIKWVEDENPDLEFIGKFTDSYEEGAIELKGASGNEYKYFVSGNHAVFDKKSWSHVPGKDVQKVIRKHGSLANVTRFYAREDMKRLESFYLGKWCMTGCIVSGVYGALEASDSLWGIESDCSDRYRKSTERDRIASVVAELRSKLKGAKTA